MLPADLKDTEVMDENRVTGSAQQLGGNAKELTGSALGDTKLQVEGKADKAEGTVRNAVGGAKDAVGDLTQTGRAGHRCKSGVAPDRVTPHHGPHFNCIYKSMMLP